MEPQSYPEILTPPQLADWLQVGEKWVEKNTQARRIPGQFKAGKYWRYDRLAIEKHRLATNSVLLPEGRK